MTNGDRLRKIRNRAKMLQKERPGMKYAAALKVAGAEYREGKSVGRRPAKKRAPAKKRTPRKRSSVGGLNYSGGSVSIGATMTESQHKAALCKKIEEKLAKAYIDRDKKKTKTERRKADKKISELRAKYRRAEKL